MDTATRVILADLAGSFLLLMIFALFAIAVVVAYMLWRGLGIARPAARRLVHDLQGKASQLESGARSTARAVIEPQVALVSRWVALRTTVAALLSPGRDNGSSSPDL